MNSQSPTNPARELQQQVREALRSQHPEWVQPSGECPTCEDYVRRLGELLQPFTADEDRTAA